VTIKGHIGAMHGAGGKARLLLCLTLGIISATLSGAHAQQAPVPSAEDSRIAILRYGPGAPAQLHAIAGIALPVLMPRGEHVQRVTVGDPGAVRVEVPGDHDGIVLSALRPLNEVSLTVETEQQSYQFSLSVTYQGPAPWLVRIERGGGAFPATPPRVWTPPAILTPGTWKLKGDKALQPTMIRDDGEKISLQWSSAQDVPAVFALDNQGHEQMVNGYMRGDLFVIDRIFEHLVFRIDKAMASANRSLAKPKK
jgi:type IV secretion system protein VirB9